MGGRSRSSFGGGSLRAPWGSIRSWFPRRVWKGARLVWRRQRPFDRASPSVPWTPCTVHTCPLHIAVMAPDARFRGPLPGWPGAPARIRGGACFEESHCPGGPGRGGCARAGHRCPDPGRPLPAFRSAGQLLAWMAARAAVRTKRSQPRCGSTSSTSTMRSLATCTCWCSRRLRGSTCGRGAVV